MALGKNAKLDLIKGVPLFEHCSKSELQHIAQIADEIDLREGKELIREGERGREFFVIVSGEVDVRRKGRKIATLGPVGSSARWPCSRRRPGARLSPPDAFGRVGDHRPGVSSICSSENTEIWLKVTRALAERLGNDELGNPRLGVGAVDSRVRDLAQAANFAALTVQLPSGAAMTHVMWVDADDDHC